MPRLPTRSSLQKRIVCSDSDAMKIAGKVKEAFFDKTGALTKQGLEYLHDNCCENGKPVSGSAGNVMMLKAMSTCHTLTLSSSGNCIGHFLDKVMFEASKAEIAIENSHIFVKRKGEAPDIETTKILCRHEFDHHRMTQSVLMQDEAGGIVAIVKGSPESIKRRCVQGSLPQDYDDIVRKRSKEGTYQIAVAVRLLEKYDQGVNRDDFEDELSFVGFIDFKNVLRDETCGVIRDLKDGDVTNKIVTGDSVHTGIKIAQESGIIDAEADVIVGQEVGLDGEIIWLDNESDKRVVIPSDYDLARGATVLAVNGEVWNYMKSKGSSANLASYISVFGRCTPNDKCSIVDHSVRSGTICLMCGDGGNDCGALRTANIGIALSDAEASIVSPFTSLDKSMTDVVQVLREGRCCLANSFASYKFMIIYGQVKVMMNFMMASFSVNFPLWNWFLTDGFWLVTIGFSLPLSRAAKRLAPERPTSSLLGVYTMPSTLGILIINVLFGAGALLLLANQPWHQCRKWGSTDIGNVRVIGDNYEAATIWLVCGPQIISTALAYNLGHRFRKAWWRNYLFVCFVLLWAAMHFYITLVPSTLSCVWRINCNNDDVVRGAFEDGPIPVQNAFNTTEMPWDYRVSILVLIIGNCLAGIGWELGVVNGAMRWRARMQKEKARKQYLKKLQLDEESVDTSSTAVGDHAV